MTVENPRMFPREVDFPTGTMDVFADSMLDALHRKGLVDGLVTEKLLRSSKDKVASTIREYGLRITEDEFIRDTCNDKDVLVASAEYLQCPSFGFSRDGEIWRIGMTHRTSHPSSYGRHSSKGVVYISNEEREGSRIFT